MANLNNISLEEQLIKLIKVGNKIQVIELIEQDVNINYRDSSQRTPLMWASHQGCLEIVSLLLDKKVDVNAIDKHGWSALMVASRYGHLDIVKLLVKYGGDIHYMSRNVYSILSWAAMYDHLSLCLYLLSLGVDLMATNNNIQKSTALDIYGIFAKLWIHPTVKKARCLILEKAFRNGPHPTQKELRWNRRKSFIIVITENKYRLLLCYLLSLQLVDTKIPIKTIIIKTKEQKHQYLLSKIFSIDGIVRLIISFL